MYSSEDRCLFVHDEEFRRWIDEPWIGHRGSHYSLRDFTSDPGIDHVIGCVFHSEDDSLTQTVEIRGSWIFLDVLSADRFLDKYHADWQKEIDGEAEGEERHGMSLRGIDDHGLIIGPVDRILFANMDEHLAEALAIGAGSP